jgi:hypothetical protein
MISIQVSVIALALAQPLGNRFFFAELQYKNIERRIFAQLDFCFRNWYTA